MLALQFVILWNLDYPVSITLNSGKPLGLMVLTRSIHFGKSEFTFQVNFKFLLKWTTANLYLIFPPGILPLFLII